MLRDLDGDWLVQYSFDSAPEKFRYRTLVLFLNQLARRRCRDSRLRCRWQRDRDAQARG